MDYEKVGSVFFNVVWGALRICSALIVVVLGFCLAAVVVMSKPWEPVKKVVVDPLVCGRMSGVVYELHRGYVIYWPEYEGKSSWEVGFTKNKKGCDANLVSLFLAMSWPELKPVSFSDATSFSFSGVTVGVEPWGAGESGLRAVLRSYLRATPESIVAQAVYENKIGMSYVEGIHRAFPDRKQDFFWLEEDGRMKYIVYCVKAYKADQSYCDLRYLLPGADVLVSIQFLRGRLSDWREVVSKVDGFLSSAVKKDNLND